MLRYVLAWFAMLVIAIANGALRQTTFAKAMSELHAHQLSTFIGSVFIGAFIWLVVRIWRPSSTSQALQIGFVWLLLTVAFETFMVVGLNGQSLSAVLNDYNLSVGRVWVLFLIWLAVAPWVFLRLTVSDQMRP